MADIPPMADYDVQVLGYMKEAIEEGEAFLKHQRGYNIATRTMKAIDGVDMDKSSGPDFSSTRVNHVSKVATDLTALCTDVKPFWDYRTKNDRFKKHCEIVGGLSEHWWLTRLIDLKNADVMRYSLCAGSGYAHLYYNSNIQDLDVSAEDPRDILPIRPPSTSWSLQECFGVIHRVQRTVNYVRRRFPNKAHLIIPDRDGALSTMSTGSYAGKMFEKFDSPFHQHLFGEAPKKELARIPSVDLYTCYITDDSVNKTGHDVGIGDFFEGKPINNWSYVVKPGQPLYPRKRCIIFTNTAILYDGPSVFWHGMYPFAKLTLDPWPWSWLGKGVLWDLLPIQGSLNQLLRAVDDYVEKVLRPAVVADKTSVSAAELRKIDTRKAGLKVRQTFMGSKGGFQIEGPGELPNSVMEIIKYYEEKLYDLPGVRDLSALMKLNQIPSSDTVEKLLESMSPSVKLRSRVIEAYMRDFATMTAWNFAQFYTLPQRLAILGPAGATEDDFDLDQDTFIPAWLDKDYSPEGVITTEALTRGPLPRYDRAKYFFRQISYHIAPSSLLNASEIQNQLKYLQLSRAGLVDHWTLLEVLNVPNVGNPPEGATTITERLMMEQQMGLGMIVSSAGRKSSGQEQPQNRSSGAVSESG